MWSLDIATVAFLILLLLAIVLGWFGLNTRRRITSAVTMLVAASFFFAIYYVKIHATLLWILSGNNL